MGSHALLQGIFLTQETNPGLLHCRQILYHLNHQNVLTLKKKLYIVCLKFKFNGEMVWPP